MGEILEEEGDAQLEEKVAAFIAHAGETPIVYVALGSNVKPPTELVSLLVAGLEGPWKVPDCAAA